MKQKRFLTTFCPVHCIRVSSSVAMEAGRAVKFTFELLALPKSITIASKTGAAEQKEADRKLAGFRYLISMGCE